MSEQKTSVTASTSATTSAASTTATAGGYRLPTDLTLQHACKLAIVEDKPILMDYWTNSLDKKALIGIREGGEKLLVKNEEEYTSPIAKFYKSGTDFIIITENSIYLVSAEIPTRKIS